MRARNIKPGLFQNELLGIDETDPMLMIVFAGLWCCADKAGRMLDRPLKIKKDIFPYRTMEPRVFNGYLTGLETLGFLLRYEIDDLAIIQVINFEGHQSPHHTEKESVLPPPPPELLETHKVAEVTGKHPLFHGEPTDLKRSGFTDSLDSLDSKELSVSVETPPEPEVQTSKKSKSAKPRDERVDHPALKMVLEIMARWPNKGLWDRIIREIGDKPDVVFFTASYQTWLGVNGNPQNLEKWLFIPAKTGMLPEVYGSGNGKHNSATSANGNGPNIQRANEIIADSQRFERPEGI